MNDVLKDSVWHKGVCRGDKVEVERPPSGGWKGGGEVRMARFCSYFEGRTARICWRIGCHTKTGMEDAPASLA